MAAPLPANEPARLHALRALRVMDSPPDPELDELALLAAEICVAPAALISFIDEEREWFKARVGIEIHELHRDLSFCAHAIAQQSALEVNDARTDERFNKNPLVVGELNLTFYAGAPLITREGLLVGVLCVLDTTPRKLTGIQWHTLRVLANAIMWRLECGSKRER